MIVSGYDNGDDETTAMTSLISLRSFIDESKYKGRATATSPLTAWSVSDDPLGRVAATALLSCRWLRPARSGKGAQRPVRSDKGWLRPERSDKGRRGFDQRGRKQRP